MTQVKPPEPPLLVAPCDRQEIRRLQTGPADQCAIDVGLAQQLFCVRRFHTAAVLKANLVRHRRVKHRREQLADLFVAGPHVKLSPFERTSSFDGACAERSRSARDDMTALGMTLRG